MGGGEVKKNENKNKCANRGNCLVAVAFKNEKRLRFHHKSIVGFIMQLKLDVCLTEIHNKVCKKGWCVDLKGYSLEKKKKKEKLAGPEAK